VDPTGDAEIAELLSLAQTDVDAGVRAEVRVAAAGTAKADGNRAWEDTMLSTIEKITFLKDVPFFLGMTVEQLRVLADVCEEEFFPAQTRLFCEGDPGGTLYIVINGRVCIEHEKRKDSFARLATVGAHSYLGETDFFDNDRRTNAAIAIQDTLTLRLCREPLIALARQYPDLSLELINVLSIRLREANERIAELLQTHPRELHRLFDQLT
jgi:CRP/FNR family transcriptional regulator, cyclic AMP receptor protein